MPIFDRLRRRTPAPVEPEVPQSDPKQVMVTLDPSLYDTAKVRTLKQGEAIRIRLSTLPRSTLIVENQEGVVTFRIVRHYE